MSGDSASVLLDAMNFSEIPSSMAAEVPCDTPWIYFQSSAIHGLGGFARADFPVGARLIEYVGERISKAESRRRCERSNEFIFALNDEWDLDGGVGWNPARFINHSCRPNCEAQWVHDGIWIVSIRCIRASEEVTINYGYDLVDYQEHPCRCGSPGCVGYIVAEAFFEQIRRRSDPNSLGFSFL